MACDMSTTRLTPPRSCSYLLRCNGLLARLVEFFNRLLIITQILLTADENDGETTAEMQDFGDPLCSSTCQRVLIVTA